MITLIAFIAILYLVFRFYKNIWWSGRCMFDRDFEGFFVATLSSVLVTVGISAAGFGLFCLFSIWLPAKEIARHDCYENIYSLKQNQQLEGRFFLGSGYVDSFENYFVFVKNDRGGFTRDTFPAYKTVIYQDENKQPMAKWQKITYEENRWLTLFPFKNYEDTIYDLHVPANTIIQEFRLE